MLMVADATFAEDCKQLSDEELIEAVLTYEQSRLLIPDEYEFGSPLTFLERQPGCCAIERENHDFTPLPSIFDWFMPYDAVMVSIGFPYELPSREEYIVVYLVSPCGVVGDRFGQHVSPLSSQVD
ncbi:hypothetical protein [Yoonia sp. 2307UL14-13]|uniref:hypothetical protein n=1 Tax=Yoonia sp. 2307UL14-13 TaxID=3126506 RepID=UPI0030AE1328